MLFSEPTTMATDYALAVLCGFFAWRLWKVGWRDAQTSVCSWAAGFVCFGVASLAGGTFHGFSTLFSEPILQELWKLTVYAIGLASFFLLTGIFNACLGPSVRRFAMLMAYVQLIIYVLWMATHNDFRYVIYEYAFTNLGILALQCYADATRRAGSVPWLAGGVLVSFAAAVIQISGVALHQHFNHNDLYHVVQAAGMYLFYRGALVLNDRQPSRPPLLSEPVSLLAP